MLRFSARHFTLLAFAVAACAEDTTAPDSPLDQDAVARQVASIVLLNPVSTVAIGASAQLVASVLNASGVAVSGSVTWTSSQPQIASVASSGQVTGVAAGTSVISARSGEHSASIAITVEAPVCSAATATSPFSIGQTASGTLTSSNCLFSSDGRRAVGRRMSFTEPTMVRFTMTSTQFTPFIWITDLAMGALYGMSESGDPTRVELLMAFEPGTYLVWMSATAPSSTGSFTFGAAPVIPCSAGTAVGTLTAGQTISSAIVPDSCVLPHLQRSTGWRISVAVETALLFEVQGAGFQPVLIVTGTEASLPIAGIAFPDQTGRAALPHLFAPGEYLLWVTTSYGSPGGSTGNFTLSASTTVIASCDAINGVVAIGQSVASSLDPGDCQTPISHFTEVWELTVNASATIQIDHVSDQFDPYLYVRNAQGVTIAQDDDSGIGLNARIVRAFAPGTYRILATSCAFMEVGTYTLSVQSLTGGAVQARLLERDEAKSHSAGAAAWGKLRPGGR